MNTNNYGESVTVLGAGGWIGSALVTELRRQSTQVIAVNRDNLSAWLKSPSNNESIIYAIGITSDFRHRPFETIEAHITLLSQVLQRPGIKRLLYLSSSRVYARSHDTRESTCLPCLSSDPSDLYNLSKLTGESLVLQSPNPGFKACRLSNVVGPGQPQTTFIGSLLHEVKTTGFARIRQHPRTSKDYISIFDTAKYIPAIAREGSERLYNLGSGSNHTHQDVAEWLRKQGATVEFTDSAEEGPSFPALNIERLRAEFGQPGEPLAQWLPKDYYTTSPA